MTESAITKCQFCQANLLTDGIKSGQQFRCANCQAILRVGDEAKVATDKLAWRSFWLGLSSIVLLFFTGIPAIYYGVRSLLRMRFVKPKRSDQAAAVLGTAMGGCFGLVFGLSIVTIAGTALAIYATRWDSTNEQVILKTMPRHFRFDAPRDLLPLKVKSILNSQFEYTFADQRKESECHVRVVLAYAPKSLQVNQTQVMTSLDRELLNGAPRGKRVQLEMLEWSMGGQSLPVRKTVFRTSKGAERSIVDPDVSNIQPNDDDTVETHQYLGVLTRDRGLYGVAVLVHPQFSQITEEEVRAIFAKIQPGDPAYRAPELKSEAEQSEQKQSEQDPPAAKDESSD